MASSTLTSKGQITIPVSIRERLGLHTGDRVDFIPERDGTVRLRMKRIPFDRLRGILRKSGQKPVTVEQMDDGIRTVIRNKWARLNRMTHK